MFETKVTGSLETIDTFLRQIVEIGDNPQYYDRSHIEEAIRKNIEGKDREKEHVTLLMALTNKKQKAKDKTYRRSVQKNVVYDLTEEVRRVYDKELKKRKWNKRIPTFIGWYNNFADGVTRALDIDLPNPKPKGFEIINLPSKKYPVLVGPLGENDIKVEYRWNFFEKADLLSCFIKIKTDEFNLEGLTKLENAADFYK